MCSTGEQVVAPQDLLCEYRVNPLGIDNPSPRFSWKVVTQERGSFQTGYQVLVSQNLENLERDIGDMWDSGKVETRQSLHVVYGGKPLQSRTRYYWKVRIWDQQGRVSPYSAPAWFETAFLSQEDWRGVWIASPSVSKLSSAPMFRKEFLLTKEISRARAYISGLGYYELRINGQKVGDHVLDPAWTDYTKRVFYVTYDVTPYLRKGPNAIGVILGNGWFAYSLTRMHPTPQLLFQLHIEFQDGTEECIVSDRSWQVTVNGPIVENSIYHGEIYDARLEKPGWDMPGYTMDPREWCIPIIAEPPGGIMVAQFLEPIKVVQDVIPVNVSSPKPGIYVFDFGQNIAGWVKLRVRGPKGTKVTMRFAELLYEDGTVNQENLRAARATDVYVLKGEGVEVYEPRFTYHGFRYVQLEGLPEKPGLEDVVGRVVRSSVKQIGSFRCSHELLNKIQQNAFWTEANNLHGIPTDCPQRDERLGWLNDMTVRAEAALYNFDLACLYTKWLDDIKDTQDPATGAIADTAPFRGYGRRPADPVAMSYLVVPWLLYVFYGDRQILEKHYEGMKRWIAYLEKATDEAGIVSYSYYGDWSPPLTESVPGSIGAGALSATTPGVFVSTCLFYYGVLLLSKVAGVLGEHEDEEYYTSLAAKTREAINRVFLDAEAKTYATGSQTCHVLPLFLKLVPDEYDKDVLQNLVEDIEKRGGHLATGNLGSKYLMDVLSEYGRADVAYVLATQTTYPSWGYMVMQGATTMWERWEYVTGGWQAEMASHCHPMNATVSAWFYKTLGGIMPVEEDPGFGRIIIRPYMPRDLTSVECVLQTLRGPVRSEWRRTSQGFVMNVAIPWNAMASIHVPIDKESAREIVIQESGQTVWEKGRCVDRTAGIVEVSTTESSIVFLVGSGTYRFEVIDLER